MFKNKPMAKINLEGKVDHSIHNLLFTTTVTQNMMKVGVHAQTKNFKVISFVKRSVFTFKHIISNFIISFNMI